MHRRDFLAQLIAATVAPPAMSSGERIALAARSQIGVTRSYDPAYIRLTYPNGDVPRSSGICADVVVRACRDALSLDLQKLVHEDMLRGFDAYPRTWRARHPDASIDHRRVLNLEVFWQRSRAVLWTAKTKTAGDAFQQLMRLGDFLTWRINGSLPHVGVLGGMGSHGWNVIHNIGSGAEETPLAAFAPHPAIGHYRWPASRQ